MLVRTANREDLDQTASSEAVRSGSALFVYALLATKFKCSKFYNIYRSVHISVIVTLQYSAIGAILLTATSLMWLLPKNFLPEICSSIISQLVNSDENLDRNYENLYKSLKFWLLNHL